MSMYWNEEEEMYWNEKFVSERISSKELVGKIIKKIYTAEKRIVEFFVDQQKATEEEYYSCVKKGQEYHKQQRILDPLGEPLYKFEVAIEPESLVIETDDSGYGFAAHSDNDYNSCWLNVKSIKGNLEGLIESKIKDLKYINSRFSNGSKNPKKHSFGVFSKTDTYKLITGVGSILIKFEDECPFGFGSPDLYSVTYKRFY